RARLDARAIVDAGERRVVGEIGEHERPAVLGESRDDDAWLCGSGERRGRGTARIERESLARAARRRAHHDGVGIHEREREPHRLFGLLDTGAAHDRVAQVEDLVERLVDRRHAYTIPWW